MSDEAINPLPSASALLKRSKAELAHELWGELQTNRELNSQLKAARGEKMPTPEVESRSNMKRKAVLDRTGKGQQDIPKSALEKLRELEAKWRTKVEPLACGNTAAAGCVKMCADELHELFAPAPRPAEKD